MGKMKFLVIVSAFLAVSSGSIVPYAGVYGGYGYPLADGLPASAAGLVAHPNGAVTPADTPSVVAARADHLAAKGAAYAAAGPALAYGAGYGYGAVAPGPVVAAAPAIAAPVPAIAPVPAVAPAVVAARADHLAAKGAAY